MISDIKWYDDSNISTWYWEDNGHTNYENNNDIL